MSLRVPVFLLSCLGLLLGACAKEDRVIRVAVAAPMTGALAEEGEGLLRAVEMAIAEAAESQSFPHAFEVLPFDDRGDPEAAADVARLIVSDRRVAAVIGHLTSDCSIAAAPIYARADIPLLVASATHPDVTRRQEDRSWPGPKNVFRVVPHDDAQTSAAARFLRRRMKAGRLSLVHDGTAYGSGLANRVHDIFESLGGTAFRPHEIALGQKNFESLADKLVKESPDGLYFGGIYTEAGLLLKELRTRGLTAAFVSGDGARSAGFFSVAGPAAQGAYFTMPGPSPKQRPIWDAFQARFQKRYPEARLRPFDHFAYEAAEVFLDALLESGPRRGRLLEALRRTDRVGITGRIRFNEIGDVMRQDAAISRAEADTKRFVSLPE